MNTKSSSLLSLKEKGPDEQMKQEPMADEEFLDLLQKQCALFFYNEANPNTGLIKDRVNNFSSDNHVAASTASTGFGLTALIIAEKHGWLSRDETYDRVLTTLKFAKNTFYNKNGFFFHFVDVNTVERKWNSEISSIDTALFLAGALVAGQFYKGTEVETLANDLYTGANWQWICADQKFLNMGYWPESKKFHPFFWNIYNEGLLANILAIGSPSFPISPDVWHNIERPVGYYKGYKCIACAPLFTHQYPNLWIDFRNKHDGHADYFENARIATLANRQYCIDRMNKYKTYGPDLWGLTAADSPDGYNVFGALPGNAFDDGTVAPTAAGGSMMFTPKESLSALKYMYYTFKERIWGKYGFCDAFNVDRDWNDPDVLGIDLGAIVLSIENYRTGFVWKHFMKIPYIQDAMQKIGFKDKPEKNKLDIIDLKGAWEFNISDNSLLKNASYNDSIMQEIDVPVLLEDHSYFENNSIAVFKKSFVIPKELKSKWLHKDIVVHMGSISNFDMTYVNGVKIGGKEELRKAEREASITIKPENMDVNSGWRTHADEGGSQSSISNVSGINAEALSMNFDLGTGAWALTSKVKIRDFRKLTKMHLSYKYEGTPNALEIKLIDTARSHFGYKEEIKETSQWETIELDISRFTHWWGGNKILDLEHIRKVEIVISKKTSGKGNLTIDGIQYYLSSQANICEQWKHERIYRIPYDCIKFGEKNTIVVKIFKGSICSEPIRIAPLEDIQYEPIKFEIFPLE